MDFKKAIEDARLANEEKIISDKNNAEEEQKRREELVNNGINSMRMYVFPVIESIKTTLIENKMNLVVEEVFNVARRSPPEPKIVVKVTLQKVSGGRRVSRKSLIISPNDGRFNVGFSRNSLQQVDEPIIIASNSQIKESIEAAVHKMAVDVLDQDRISGGI